jgi:ATP-dependent Clp protease protease subunit
MSKRFPIFNAVVPIKAKPTAGAKPSGYRVVANKASDSAEIYVYGVIGGDWFGDGVTPSSSPTT